MADKIRGITIELGGDASGLSKALKGVNSEIKDTQSQLKDVERLLKIDPGNIELLEQKQRLLNDSAEEYRTKLENLKKAQENFNEETLNTKEGQAAWDALNREIISTEDYLAKAEKKASDFDTTLSKVSATASEVSEKAGKVAEATQGLSTAAGAVLGAGVVGVGKIVENFSEYEQLIGGTKLLFGDAYDYIAERAESAYGRVQLSQSDYLQQVNGFATGLKTALGGDEQAAAELADKIITAEADVVAATGNSQEAVQNAFNGIMKSNFTMLDNLQLGITPTKEGFQEVIDKVNEWNAANGNATDYVIDSLADCEAALVDYIDMQGLAGYAAEEGASTISGAFESTQAALDNLITGLGTADADVDTLVQNVVDSASNVYDAVIPVLQAIWDNLPSSVKIIAGILIVVAAISPLATAISNVATAVEVITTKVIPALGKAMGWLLENPMALVIVAIIALVALIATKGDEIQALLQKLDDWLQNIFARDWTEIFGPVLGNILNGFMATVKNVWDGIKQIFDGVIDFIRGVFTGDWSRAWNGVKEIFSGVFGALSGIASGPINAVIGIVNGAIDSVNWLIQKINAIPFVNIPTIGKMNYFAKGGSLTDGGTAIVGEAGPELLTVQGGRAIVTPLGGNMGGTTNNSSTTNMGGINLTINGAPGQDVRELADLIMDEMQAAVNRKGAVFA